MESNTKTIAKRPRVGPRTQVHVTMKKLFWRRMSSKSSLRVSVIGLDNILKIWIELIKLQNDDATEKFYRVRVVFKS